MAKIRITTRVSGPADEIACAKCGRPSFERGSETDPALSADFILLTFECGTCGHFETRSAPKNGKVH